MKIMFRPVERGAATEAGNKPSVSGKKVLKSHNFLKMLE